MLNLCGGVGFSMQYEGYSWSQSSLREVKPKKDHENLGNRNLDTFLENILSLCGQELWKVIL